MSLFNLLGNPRANGNRLILNAGFTAPTGSIDEGEDGQRFEYEMQLGSGTFDLLPGLTYLGESETLAWGAQALGTVRLGSNANDYRLGNAYRLSAWTQLKVTDWFGPSIRLDWHAWEDIHGADPTLNPARNPAFDATKQCRESAWISWRDLTSTLARAPSKATAFPSKAACRFTRASTVRIWALTG